MPTVAASLVWRRSGGLSQWDGCLLGRIKALGWQVLDGRALDDLALVGVAGAVAGAVPAALGAFQTTRQPRWVQRPETACSRLAWSR